MTMSDQTIVENLKKLRHSIERAAFNCNRNPEDIKLVAVSKRFPISAIEAACAAGQVTFGENYIQEAVEKKQALGDRIQLHFIGNLQSNKAKLAALNCAMVETIDRPKIARSLHRHLDDIDRTMDILIQVNVGRDPNKSGVLASEAEALLVNLQKLSRLRPCGLMTMPPYTPDPEAARPYFKALRQLAETLRSRGLFSGIEKIELSMGMSHDFHIAIEEGATLVRVGTAIFGERP
jgi:pyridoxal phosphate enzyme (YggS family)